MSGGAGGGQPKKSQAELDAIHDRNKALEEKLQAFFQKFSFQYIVEYGARDPKIEPYVDEFYMDLDCCEEADILHMGFRRKSSVLIDDENGEERSARIQLPFRHRIEPDEKWDYRPSFLEGVSHRSHIIKWIRTSEYPCAKQFISLGQVLKQRVVKVLFWINESGDIHFHIDVRHIMDWHGDQHYSDAAFSNLSGLELDVSGFVQKLNSTISESHSNAEREFMFFKSKVIDPYVQKQKKLKDRQIFDPLVGRIQGNILDHFMDEPEYIQKGIIHAEKLFYEMKEIILNSSAPERSQPEKEGYSMEYFDGLDGMKENEDLNFIMIYGPEGRICNSEKGPGGLLAKRFIFLAIETQINENGDVSETDDAVPRRKKSVDEVAYVVQRKYFIYLNTIGNLTCHVKVSYEFKASGCSDSCFSRTEMGSNDTFATCEEINSFFFKVRESAQRIAPSVYEGWMQRQDQIERVRSSKAGPKTQRKRQEPKSGDGGKAKRGRKQQRLESDDDSDEDYDESILVKKKPNVDKCEDHKKSTGKKRGRKPKNQSLPFTVDTSESDVEKRRAAQPDSGSAGPAVERASGEAGPSMKRASGEAGPAEKRGHASYAHRAGRGKCPVHNKAAIKQEHVAGAADVAGAAGAAGAAGGGPVPAEEIYVNLATESEDEGQGVDQGAGGA